MNSRRWRRTAGPSVVVALMFASAAGANSVRSAALSGNDHGTVAVAAAEPSGSFGHAADLAWPECETDCIDENQCSQMQCIDGILLTTCYNYNYYQCQCQPDYEATYTLIGQHEYWDPGWCNVDDLYHVHEVDTSECGYPDLDYCYGEWHWNNWLEAPYPGYCCSEIGGCWGVGGYCPY